MNKEQQNVQVTHTCDWVQVSEGQNQKLGPDAPRCVIITFGENETGTAISFAFGKQDVVNIINNLQSVVLQS